METKDKLEELKKRKAKIDQQISKLKARQAANERKEDTRLKMLVGAALLTDAKTNPNTAAAVKEVLGRTITAEGNRRFLQSKGWLEGGQQEEKTEPVKSGP